MSEADIVYTSGTPKLWWEDPTIQIIIQLTLAKHLLRTKHFACIISFIPTPTTSYLSFIDEETEAYNLKEYFLATHNQNVICDLPKIIESSQFESKREVWSPCKSKIELYI